MSIFNNESILAWLKYFSDHSEIDLSTVRILDITGENRNLLPTVQANRSVLVFRLPDRPGQRQLFSRHHPVRGAGDSGGHSEKALPG